MPFLSQDMAFQACATLEQGNEFGNECNEKNFQYPNESSDKTLFRFDAQYTEESSLNGSEEIIEESEDQEIAEKIVKQSHTHDVSGEMQGENS